MIKVSVIIPVYNAEKYLRQCLDSVLSQSLKEIEVICVDDGSADKSRDILGEYAKKDSRISTVYNETNMHAGVCRNIGIEKASGDYLFFMDADDTMLPGGLENVYLDARATGADVVRCRAIDRDEKTGQFSKNKHNALRRIPFFLYNRRLTFNKIYFLLPKITVAPWGGMVKREFIQKNKIRFNDLICVNDRSFFWETMLRSDFISFSRHYLIQYRTNISQSLVGGRIRNFDCHFKSYDTVAKLTENCPRRVRRCLLGAELLDIAHWLEAGRKTEYASQLEKEIEIFLEYMDKSLWGGKIEKTKWFRRIDTKF